MTADEIIVQTLPFHGELDSLHFLTGDFIGHVALIIHQDTVPLVGNIKRNVFVGNLTGCAAVFIPHFHSLSVFHERCKPFAKTVNILIHINEKLFHHIVLSGFPVVHMCQVAEAGLCQELVPLIKSQLIRIRRLVDHCP